MWDRPPPIINIIGHYPIKISLLLLPEKSLFSPPLSLPPPTDESKENRELKKKAGRVARSCRAEIVHPHP